MIAYIKGILSSIQDESVVVDVHGVGYELICANPFAFQSALNEEILINTYQYVREDTLVLYGFKNEDEKYLFKKLISVSGIGPKGALAILASVDISAFVSAVEREDDKFLTSFPGVGKKTARQIILDLKGKLVMELTVSVEQDQEVAAITGSETKLAITEAQEALKALGYTDREIKAVIPKLQAMDNKNTDEVIKNALALLMKN
ncbi:Holliday junction branch migration protein RuvA [Oceanobacillus sp. 143]|uniref:Holliday junction branch migration complex subunit RuvA n=1 Tax=Oceanobacillus zhaokaii TaxID=2052660 RepID=A0A345PHU9_9BACI|nr:Holliday junction branch migration protein RuvA [Oceanobacillus zhaokaii]AXI09579.1 Holliday junction branch migration protein RuvA [Oceanobacillus zhaokaii]QGS68951.1 Holliday junction branch migration protein RuvA [Oceanobacillus sp. 143]